MKKFVIRFNPEAIDDLSDSYEWGVEFWGLEAAGEWYNEIGQFIEDRLSTMPKSCPLAPENDVLDIGIRQLIFGRYRILFMTESNTVYVLHIRGPYSLK